MTSALVNPVAGYSTLSRLRERELAAVDGDGGAARGLAAGASGPVRRACGLGGVLALVAVAGRRLRPRPSGGGLGRLRPVRRVAACGLLGRLHARLSAAIRSTTCGAAAGRLGRLELLAGGLLPDEVEHLLAVVVVVPLRLERAGQRLDELLGHRQLLGR